MIKAIPLRLLRPHSSQKAWLWVLAMTVYFIATISSCTEEEFTPDPIPKITLMEIAPTNVKQFTDSIGIVIKYEDGDGDIGFANPDSLSLSVQDLRLTTPDYFYIPPLTPNEQTLNIEGTARVVIRNTFLLGNGDEETTTYQIRLKDRAGNWSNTLTTPEITITR